MFSLKQQQAQKGQLFRVGSYMLPFPTRLDCSPAPFKKNDWEITKTNTVKSRGFNTHRRQKSEKGKKMALQICKMISQTASYMRERQAPLKRNIESCPFYDFPKNFLKKFKRKPFSISTSSTTISPNKYRKIFIQILKTTTKKRKITTTTLISRLFFLLISSPLSRFASKNLKKKMTK